MATDTIEQKMGCFFAALKPGVDDALVFTTFGLDEVVLSELLKRYAVPPTTRIVVFHDVMKHRHPGFLQHRYQESLTVAVQLPARAQICPVFHAKVWMSVSEKPFRCRRLAVHSFNLTRYHLDESRATFETSSVWTALNLSVPHQKVFSPARIFGGHGHIRLEVEPFTLLVDVLNGKPSIVGESHSAWRAIASAARVSKGPVLACAAPFIKPSAMQFFADLNRQVRPDNPFQAIRAYGESRKGTVLHAKVIELERLVVAGSVNLTAQALGLGEKKPVNCEAVLTMRRPKGFRLSRLLRGFPRIMAGTHDHEPPGDTDPNDDAGNWAEQKRLAESGPWNAVLALAGGKAQVHLKGGSLGGAKTIVIEAPAENYGEGDTPLRVASRQVLCFPREQQQRQLATVLRQEGVTVSGIAAGKSLWRLELDLGEMWNWFEHHGRSSGGGGSSGNGDDGRRDGRQTEWEDVRDLRRRAFESERFTEGARAWDKWWLRYGEAELPTGKIPDWCADIGRKLRRQRGENG